MKGEKFMTNDFVHWRELMDPKFLRAELFAPGERKVVTIKEIVREDITNPKLQMTEAKTVAYFEEDVKPLVLNVTNQETIEKVLGTGNVREWIGRKIQLFATKTKVRGQAVPCIRVENVAPQTHEVIYSCCVCGKPITKEFYEGSVKKYGKPYCSGACRDRDTLGEVVLTKETEGEN